jgi:uncharacterized protein YciI
MPHFLIIYRPPRSTFVDDATEEESAVIGRHAKYLQQKLDAGQVLMAGRIDDGRMGIALLEVDSEQTAQSLMDNDPAVANRVFSAELAPFGLAMMVGKTT